MTSSRVQMLQCVQVGNVAAGVTDAQLRELFLPSGQIVSFERPLAQKTEEPGMFAYIEMASDEADVAIAALHGRVVNGSPLEVMAWGRSRFRLAAPSEIAVEVLTEA
jgi:RNA recognition motif-containing protein